MEPGRAPASPARPRRRAPAPRAPSPRTPARGSVVRGEEAGAHGEAGVVDEFDRPRLVLEPLGHPLTSSRSPRSAANCSTRGPSGMEPGRLGLQPRGVAGDEHEVQAAGRERPGERGADAGGGARDERGCHAAYDTDPMTSRPGPRPWAGSPGTCSSPAAPASSARRCSSACWSPTPTPASRCSSAARAQSAEDRVRKLLPSPSSSPGGRRRPGRGGRGSSPSASPHRGLARRGPAAARRPRRCDPQRVDRVVRPADRRGVRHQRRRRPRALRGAAESGADPHVVHVSTCYVGGMRKGVLPEACLMHDVDWRAESDGGRGRAAARRARSRASPRRCATHAAARAAHGKEGPQAVAQATEAARSTG